MRNHIQIIYLLIGSIVVLLIFFIQKQLDNQLDKLLLLQDKVKKNPKNYMFCVIFPSPTIDTSYCFILVKEINSADNYQLLTDTLLSELTNVINTYKLSLDNFDEKHSMIDNYFKLKGKNSNVT